MSAPPSPGIVGVPTQMKIACAPRIASRMSPVNDSRPARWLAATSSLKPGS
jgi:hypothetical protein